jgi:hypothetical protein
MLYKSTYESNLCDAYCLENIKVQRAYHTISSNLIENIKVQRAYHTISSNLMDFFKMLNRKIDLDFEQAMNSYDSGSLLFNKPQVHVLHKDAFGKYEDTLISCYDGAINYALLMTRAVAGKSFYLYPDHTLLLGDKPYTNTALLAQFSYSNNKHESIHSYNTETRRVNHEAVTLLQAHMNDLRNGIKTVFDMHPEEWAVMKQIDSEHKEELCNSIHNDPFDTSSHEMRTLICLNIFVLADQEWL